MSRSLIAVTGAQGVGKSTFCRALKSSLQSSVREVVLFDGLGDQLKSKGVPLGRDSNAQTIAAVFGAHLERERRALACEAIVILDRCQVDALAYTRVLSVNTEVERELYNELAMRCLRSLNAIVELKLEAPFDVGFAEHETEAIRRGVAAEIACILDSLELPRIRLNAEDADAITGAVRFLSDISGAQ